MHKAALTCCEWRYCMAAACGSTWRGRQGVVWLHQAVKKGSNKQSETAWKKFQEDAGVQQLRGQRKARSGGSSTGAHGFGERHTQHEQDGKAAGTKPPTKLISRKPNERCAKLPQGLPTQQRRLAHHIACKGQGCGHVCASGARVLQPPPVQRLPQRAWGH